MTIVFIDSIGTDKYNTKIDIVVLDFKSHSHTVHPRAKMWSNTFQLGLKKVWILPTSARDLLNPTPEIRV